MMRADIILCNHMYSRNCDDGIVGPQSTSGHDMQVAELPGPWWPRPKEFGE